MKYMMPMNGEWIVFEDKQLLAMGEESADNLRTLYERYTQNRLGFYLAHSGGKDFLNDWDSGFSILFSGNRFGKSDCGAAWLGFRIVPCDPDWDCFKYGIDYHKFEGPVKAAACSYTIKTHLRRIIAPRLLEVLPDHELKEFSPRYRGKGKKKIDWNGASQLPLACGSTIDFLAYEQSQAAWEGSQYTKMWFDEQPSKDALDGAIERTRTGLVKAQLCATATPHVVKSFPETGTAGPLVQAAKGYIDLGLTIGVHKMVLEEVPDCIYPAENKKAAYKKWVTSPREKNDRKTLRQGRSRLFGEPESSEGLVLDDWDPEVHWIDPITIPEDWTKYRAMDHGSVNPTACLWGAVDPQGNLFLYREYYEVPGSVALAAKAILEASNSHRVKVGTVSDEETGEHRDVFEEIQTEHYYESVLDSRSFGSKGDRGVNYGELYNDFGLEVTPASGKRETLFVPVMREWFRVDPTRTHPITKKKGAPRVFVFNTLDNFRQGIEGGVFKVRKDGAESEDPAKKNDHLMDALRYMLACGPEYQGDYYTQAAEEKRVEGTSKYTGY
jgi:phage terminase large subunit-like protein